MEAVPHVVVIAFPFASHAGKLFRLARALAAAAPAATFSFLSTAGSLVQLQKQNALQENLRFVELPDGLPPPTSGAAAVPPPAHMVRVEHFLAAAEAGAVRDALDMARSSAGGARVSCVVGDAFVWMAAEATAAAGVPWVPVWTGGPSALLVHLCAQALRRRHDRVAGRADELLTSHPCLGSYRVRDLPDGILSDDIDLPIILMFRRLAERLPRAATAVVLNIFPGLLPDNITAALATELPECFPVGPFHLLPVPQIDDPIKQTDPYGCLAWLDRHSIRAVAYVSFGTIVSAVTTPEELHELAAGLEASGAPFLWSLPGELWPKLPPGFLDLERAKVVPWAPQADVLRHASVGSFFTHAGWASVLEGVSGGVPMACRPFFSDQRMNARLVAHVWAVGMAFDEPVTREGVVAAVSALLAGNGRMLGRMEELKGMAAAAFAPDGRSRKNLDKLVNLVCAVQSPCDSQV